MFYNIFDSIYAYHSPKEFSSFVAGLWVYPYMFSSRENYMSNFTKTRQTE